jgi:hypothetical protein
VERRRYSEAHIRVLRISDRRLDEVVFCRTPRGRGRPVL